MTQASAPGKIILFGEHAVVYGRPAIAVPIRQVRATAEVSDNPEAAPGEIWIEAPDVHLSSWLHEIDPQHPIACITRLTLDELEVQHLRPIRIHVTSTIPIAAGLGSGAAVSIAVLRALSKHLDQPLALDRQSKLAFEVERIHHGTPSGIDNTVITYDRPLYFVRDRILETFSIGTRFTFIIGDCGEPSMTAEVVGSVREAMSQDPKNIENLFDRIGHISLQARERIERGDRQELGSLMDQNQSLLEELGVSSPALERLIHASRTTGALGAKLSGAGCGGNMIALSEPETAEKVAIAIQQAGAVWTLTVEIDP